MKDLEIRGAGDLLGGEQSGFINEMGFETYQKILHEAIEELKENEFRELYQHEVNDKLKPYVKEVQIDTDLELFIPDNYINIVKERLSLYQELSQIKTNKKLIDFENKITDRFGPLPEPAIVLLESIKLKWVATQLGMERLIIKKGSCICYFISDQQSEFFQTKTFSFLLTKIQEDPDRITLKEKNTPNGLKLILTIQSIGEIQTLTELLDSFVLPIKTLNS